jgi:threonylcarbamoyladenosine tRNA methylthiotransferase MtaB
MARVWIAPVGCEVSRADAEALLEELAGAGHTAAARVSDAEAALVTTCCVTREAERSSRQAARRLARRGLPVVVKGCAATFDAAQFAAAGIVVAARDQATAALAALIASRGSADLAMPAAETPESPSAASRSGARHRSILKAQDGCAGVCTYCAVRLVRGALWSMPLDDALDRARRVIQGGCGEIVLSGVNLGLYRDDAGHDLAGLVRALAGLPGLARLRLSSIEPQHVDANLLAALAHPRVARHLHLPLQSADDEVLAAMRRPYAWADYQRVLEDVRRELRGTIITTDVIVGFPLESDGAFARTLDAIDAPAGLFGRVHVFPYSRRPGTAAAELPPLPDEVVRRRRDLAVAAAARSREAAARTLLGRRLDVVVEDRRDGLCRGYSSEYVRCYIEASIPPGALVRVTARAEHAEGLLCELA